jgi:uncharacterized protein (DUF2141 family)
MRSIVRFISTAALFSNIFAMNANAVGMGRLTVEVGGLRNLKGQICINVFSSSKGFPTQGANAVQQRCTKVTERQVTVQFERIPAGTYAIAVLHDANDDGQANRNPLGIPTEGFGFSQNPRILTGPPKFGEAAVLVAGRNTEVRIQLQYLL